MLDTVPRPPEPTPGELLVVGAGEPLRDQHPPAFGVDGEQPQIEERVKIGTRQNAIADIIGLGTLVGVNMRGFEQGLV
jgi:hypothetical protein